MGHLGVPRRRSAFPTSIRDRLTLPAEKKYYSSPVAWPYLWSWSGGTRTSSPLLRNPCFRRSERANPRCWRTAWVSVALAIPSALIFSWIGSVERSRLRRTLGRSLFRTLILCVAVIIVGPHSILICGGSWLPNRRPPS